MRISEKTETKTETKKTKLSTNLFVFGGLAVIIVTTLVFIFTSQPKPVVKEEPKPTETSTTEVFDPEIQSSSTPEEISKEQVETKVSGEPAPQEVVDKVSGFVNVAVEYVKTNEMASVSSDAHHLGATNDAMVSTFAMPFKFNGYNYTGTKVYTSDDEGVYQVVIELNKDGGEPVYFIGYYIESTSQLRLMEYLGGEIGVAL